MCLPKEIFPEMAEKATQENTRSLEHIFRREQKLGEVIVVTSGKGGVGKSGTTLRFYEQGLPMAEQKSRS